MKLRTLILVLFSLPSITWAEDVAVSSVTDFGALQTETNNNYYLLGDGKTYILITDITTAGYLYIQSGSTVVIDLNGHTINRNLNSPVYNGHVIKNEGTLTIKNTGNGENGKITGGFNNGSGGGIYNKGALTIEGGTITNNKARYWQSYDDKKAHGGGIMVKSGQLILKGGIITNNKANESNDVNGGYGGGVYIASDGSLEIEGNPQITDNVRYTSADNLYLASGKTITIGEGNVTGSDETIGISMQTLGTFTSGLNSETKFAIFKSDNNHYETDVADGNEAQLQTCWMGLVKKFNLGGIIELNSAKVYEASSTDPCLTVPSDKSVTLDLKGQTLDRKLTNAIEDGCVIKNNGRLSITNSTGTGYIKGGRNSTGGGGIHNLGTLTISGGNIYGNISTNQGGGILNTNSLTISGGTIESNTASNTNGGGIYNTNTGTLIISGGSIKNNSATEASRNGGGIYNAGSLTISGGEIKSNSAPGFGAGIYHDGTAFNLEGEPNISSNAGKNVYLTAAHHTITITADIGAITAIGINMENPSVFTSGLSGHGTYEKFTSEAGNAIKLTENDSGEAELITYWNYLNRQITTNGTYTLESGKTYQAASGDPYLHVASGKTITINLNGQTLNRNLSSATDNGCVIFNEGNLTIQNTGGDCSITGGFNNDETTIKGGGICNAGTLIIESGTISGNKTALLGGGIYNGGTLTVIGGTNNNNTSSGDAAANSIYHNGSQLNLEGAPNINIYLATGKIINITNSLTNSSSYPIKIATADEHVTFTTGLSGNGDASKFIANQTGKGIGLNSSGEAIIGHAYNIERSNSVSGPSASLYIKGAVSGSQTAVEGEVIKVKVVNSDGGVPVSIGYSPGSDLSPYPKSNVEYSFTMPASDVTVEAVSCWGGYCGAGSLEDIKYFLDGETLKFITKDDAADYSMVSYGAGAAPWVNKTYTSVFIPKRLGAISDYAFCDKNKKLTTFTVHADNSSFKAVGDLLFSKDENTLICYPSGKDASTYTVPSSVTVIKDGAFAFNTSLQSFTVAGGSYYSAGSDGVLYNAAGTVLICYPAGKAETLYTIESNVIEIKPYAFQSCSNLDYVYVLRTSEITTGNTAMFDGTKNSLKILVPNTVLTTYKGAEYWSNYASKIFAIDGSNFEIVLTDNKNAYDYSGSPVTPDVIQVRSLAGDGYILVKNVDYSDTYTYTNNNALGTGTITITGLGNYAGINPSTTFDITKKVVITGASGHYSTYYHAETEVLTIPDGLQAYTITGINWENGTTEINSVSCIPQNTPVLLYKSNGNCNGEYHLKVTTGSVVGVDTGFKGKSDKDSEESRSFGTLNSGFKAIYVLKGDKFYRATYGTLGTNRCYLAQPNSAGSRGLDVISIGSGDSTTTINQVGKEELSDETWYDLQGRRLGAKPTTQGVYISNGKKIVIK